MFLKDLMGAASVSGKEPGSGQQESQVPQFDCSQLAGGGRWSTSPSLSFLLFEMSLVLRRERGIHDLGSGLSVPG